MAQDLRYGARGPERYVQALARMASSAWKDLHGEYRDGLLDEAERLVLIHPSWYHGLETEGRASSIRGPRAFTRGRTTGKCQSEGTFGYSCPFGLVAVQLDHVFPYALGGPTSSDNGAWLCDFHNQCKGHDFHSLDLYSVGSNWFDHVLMRVEAIVARYPAP
jgi:hypothetical protein